MQIAIPAIISEECSRIVLLLILIAHLIDIKEFLDFRVKKIGHFKRDENRWYKFSPFDRMDGLSAYIDRGCQLVLADVQFCPPDAHDVFDFHGIFSRR
jgi:hypothetical protein